MRPFDPLRRRLLIGGTAAMATAPLTACFDAVGDQESAVRGVLEYANSLTYRTQRLLLRSNALATEFSESEIRQPQRPNGSTNPQDEAYLAHVSTGFSNYRFTVGGMVERPLSLTLDELRAMPARTQITRHDCVEGWSCIAKWTGTPLAVVLDEARVQERARFVVFTCLDTYGSTRSAYYESIDLEDARHAQTILAYGLNGEALPVANGAPLRVRVERQLGYKMAKYLGGILLVDSLESFGKGRGGFWEDYGYEWFAGI
ncbi:MAG: molybdopterin-dependent oxidoreductase [Rhizobiaceae bacterium]|nr:molybdopterin-dependent oxidoreductase [Rhizobiaceae bacterium]